MFKALVIPVEGRIYEIEVGNANGDLDVLQKAVGGWIEAVPVPGFVKGSERATAYINEEGKYSCFNEDGSIAVNRRATDFMVPGIGLMPSDFIAGPMVLTGFDPDTGDQSDLPQAVIDRVRLIEVEAA